MMKQISFILLLVTIFGCNNTATLDADVGNLITADCGWIEADFIAPPDKSKVQTWYHWINGHLSKEEITKDMENMKDVGLGGFILFNAAEGMQGLTPGNPPYYSQCDDRA